MRTEKSTLAISALARFRSRVVRAWRGLASQGTALRWSLALGVLGGLVLLGYLASPVPSGTEFLRGGQEFPSGDLIKITRALDAQHVDYRVDQGRIEVPSDRLEGAKAVLAKVAVGPRSIEELREEAIKSSLIEDYTDKERRQLKAQEEILAAMIRGLGDGIDSAIVSLRRPKAGIGLMARPSPGARATAFVYLETERGRQIRHTTVQSIQSIIIGSEPDLKPDAVTVIDRSGHHYLVAGDPNSSTISKTRALEEDLDRAILEEIDFIKGVRVTVQLVPAPASASSSASSSTVAPAPGPTATTRGPESSVGVNTPMELEPEFRPDPGQPSPPSPSPRPLALTLTPANTPTVSASTSTEPQGTRAERARVWVRVPRSYYLTKAADRDPSPDRLREIVRRTESLIQEAVAHVIPPELSAPGEPPDVKIQTIPYDDPAAVPLRSQGAVDAGRPLSWWLPAGVAGGGLTLLVSALVVWVLAGRRPAVRQRPLLTTGSGTYRRDAASEPGPGPGPSERVRELIRLNPAAAASVLHRWIGQGESLR